VSAASRPPRRILGALTALLILPGIVACASSSEEADDAPRIEGSVVTDADPTSTATSRIGVDRGDARVSGELVRRVVIHGDVETRARNGSNTCTAIGSIGGCGDRPHGAHLEIGSE